jgi:hypothetical protein
MGLPAALGVLILVAAGLRAWVSDDAYLTFRTIENFLNGYGLRWNALERVQTYTHPLWMLLMIGARVVAGEYYEARGNLETQYRAVRFSPARFSGS